MTERKFISRRNRLRARLYAGEDMAHIARAFARLCARFRAAGFIPELYYGL